MLDIDWESDVRGAWDRPQPGDLLFDARDFCKKAKDATKRALQARYGRASLLLSVASIEAVSNDTLVSIYELLVDSWPSECVNEEPWVYFKRVSDRPIERLLRRHGSLSRKIQYVLRHLRRLSFVSDDELDRLEGRLKRVIQARNRIVHMTYLLNPGKHASVLNPRQVVHLASVALDAATDYIRSVAYTFEEINLPVSTISITSPRPDWWSDKDWG